MSYRTRKSDGMVAEKPIRLRLRFSEPTMPIAETVRLRSGYDMPVIGFGTWQIPKGITAERVRDALEAGYRHIDSSISFRNQSEVGACIKEWSKVRKIKRDDLFLASKIWNTCHSREKCLEQIDTMLEDFGTTYMDLIVIQWPFGWAEDESNLWPRGNDGMMMYSNIDFMETWNALEYAHRCGKVRSIGLANFNLEQAERVFREGSIKPSVLQVEMNPYFTQVNVRQFCKDREIVLTAHMTTGNPGSAFYRKHEDPNLLHDETLKAIGRAHSKPVPSIILRWIIDIGHTAIIKATEGKRIRQNINIFKFRLTPDQIDRIESMNTNFRILNPILGNVDHPHYPWPYVPPPSWR